MDILVKEDVDGQQAHEKCSASLISREMQLETTMKYHLTPVRMAVIKKTTNNQFGKDVEERELLCTVGGNVNWCSHCGK